MTIASNSSLYLLHASKRKQFNLLTLPKSILIALLIAVLVSPCILQALGEPTWKTQLVDPEGSGGSVAIDSNGNPHIAYYTSYIVDDSSASGGLHYAIWTGENWTIQTVDPSGADASLVLDANNQPHIIYTVGDDIKYAVLNGENWGIQTIGTGGSPVLALDSNGNPHVAYSMGSGSYGNTITTSLMYAVENGSSWTTQTIETKSSNTSYGFSPTSIILNSKGYPSILYGYQVSYPYFAKELNREDFELEYNIKFASWTGTNWIIQTVAINATDGNFVLDSKGQPHLCYIHENSPYLPNYGGFMVRYSLEYTYLDGSTWVNQTIESSPDDIVYQQPFLRLEANGNPQVYFYMLDYSKNSPGGLNYASWTGSSWNIENLGSGFQLNSGYYQGSENIDDIAFDFHGNPSVITDGEVGTIRGAPQYGGLTYANLESTGISSASSAFVPLIIIATAVVLAVVVVVSLQLYMKKRKTTNLNQNLSPT